jgi:hypothetical protein
MIIRAVILTSLQQSKEGTFALTMPSEGASRLHARDGSEYDKENIVEMHS